MNDAWKDPSFWVFTVITALMLSPGFLNSFGEHGDNICYQLPEPVLQECLSISGKETASKQSNVLLSSLLMSGIFWTLVSNLKNNVNDK